MGNEDRMQKYQRMKMSAFEDAEKDFKRVGALLSTRKWLDSLPEIVLHSFYPFPVYWSKNEFYSKHEEDVALKKDPVYQKVHFLKFLEQLDKAPQKMFWFEQAIDGCLSQRRLNEDIYKFLLDSQADELYYQLSSLSLDDLQCLSSKVFLNKLEGKEFYNKLNQKEKNDKSR
jgi:hypothetical protein